MSALEVRVDRPSAIELVVVALRSSIILRVAIEETHLAEAGAIRLLSDGGDIDDTQTRAVVRLVAEAVDDVLVVIDGLGL